MKKIFLVLAAVAALAACSKSDVAYEQTDEITLTPVLKNITKSMIEGAAFPETAESFNVWAWYNQVDAGTTPANWNKNTDNLYITKGEFEHNDGNIWKGVTSYYWPKVGSLLFAGYYHTEDANVDYTFDSTTNQMVFSNIQKRQVNSESLDTHTEDLMYFNMTNTSYNSGPVPVVFKHALSWITVNLKHNGFTTNSAGYPKITVHKVDFTNVNPQGTGTVTGTDGTISWIVNGTAGEVPVTTADVVLTSESQKQTEWLFIPQVLTTDDASTVDVVETMAIRIEYTIASSESEFFKEILHAPLKGIVGKTPSLTDASATDVTINSWDPAKHYTYNIVMGLDELTIQPTVTEWATVEANIPL